MKRLLPLLFVFPTVLATARPLPLDIVLNTARELDEVLIEGQRAQDIKANPLVDDPTFLRRSYLNIIGRLPTHTEARGFLTDTGDNKRTKLIDTLIQSPGFNSRFFNFWTDLLRLKTREDHHGLGWHVWLKKAVEQNMPYDKMVQAMLSAEGHIADNPAVGYYLRDRGMLLDNVSNTVQVFLGQQIGCAQCHDHPFDDTTQMEYYQLAAFLGGTEYRFDGGRDKIAEVIGISPMKGGGKKFTKRTKAERKALDQKNKKKKGEARNLASVFRYHRRSAISDIAGQELKLPADYAYEDGKAGDTVKPGFLFGLETKDISPGNRRDHFANWVSSPKNPYFTKTISNRLWKYAFGYGLVANPDDWNSSPEPHYPELVTYLEKAMLATDYDLKQFLRILYHTQLFQREVTTEQPAQGFSFHFQGPVLRRLNAEEIRDSFVTLTSGNVDSNTNNSFQDGWEEYVTSFKVLMGSNAQQLREIDQAIDGAEAKRRSTQKQTSLLRTKLRTAKEKGDFDTAKRINLEITALKKGGGKKYRKNGNNNQSEIVKKTQAAVGRQAPVTRAAHPDFRMRASELPAPQRGGSFIAEFGGSDAEAPSSAHTQATVPQTLRLLNGNETSLLTNKKNAFARSLKDAASPAERLDLLFLSLYSALPTDAEKEAFLPETQTLESTATLARAILTSNRFLFVQ